jgi:hypothetical protein
LSCPCPWSCLSQQQLSCPWHVVLLPLPLLLHSCSWHVPSLKLHLLLMLLLVLVLLMRHHWMSAA